MSNELIGVEYSTAEGVQRAHGSPIFNCGGCPKSSSELNIQLPRVSNELFVIENSTAEDVQ
jgi:hypothetical protein